MSAVYADVNDVQARWLGGQSFTEDDEMKLQVQTLLDDAHAILRSKVPGIDGFVSEGRLPWDLVKLTIANAVVRVLNNPKGWLGTHAGEFGYYYGQTAGSTAGLISFRPDELAALGGATASMTAVQTVRMASPYVAIPDRRWR